MNILKTIAAVSAIAVSSFSVNAEVLTVGGITWDSAYVNPTSTGSDDFFAYGSYTENLDDGALSGAGVVDLVNSTDANAFCVVSGCSLTYAFEGFTVDADNNVDSTNGTLKFTVNEADGTSSLWLDLAAAGNAVYKTGTDLFDNFGTSLTALFNVLETDDTAWKNFDSNSQQDNTDLSMQVTWTATQNTASFEADSVPAPTTLAIFGLGLLGLARLRKAK